MPRPLAIGVDVGGTFTDLVVFDASTGSLRSLKVPTTPEDEGQGVLAGLRELGEELGGVGRFILGTTVATNTVLERKGATVALITTAGFRDVLEIGRTRRMIPGSMFDPYFVKPAPLVARPLRFEVEERIDAGGEVLRPVDVSPIPEIVAAARDAGAQAFAVCLLHAYRNPTHELVVRKEIERYVDAATISLSSEVVPEFREYERFSTTVINAYLLPVVHRFGAHVGEMCRACGLAVMPMVMSSSGGVVSLRTAQKLPVRTILSGPAGGVAACVELGRRSGWVHFITYDMGGTSTDVCLVRHLSPNVTSEATIGPFPLKVTQVEIVTVGAGGGSLARADRGVLEVGPQSAGATPGPACYGRGNREATVTDANVFLGRLPVDRPLGGSVRLRPDLAAAAVSKVGAELGLEPRRCAEGIVEVAVTKMAGSIREVTVERGHDPRDFVLVAFGGAGPMHACFVADALGVRQIAIPWHAGNLSALGMILSDVRHDVVRTVLRPLEARALAAVADLFRDLRREASDVLVGEGFDPERQYFRYRVDMRYHKQGFELSVALPEPTLAVADALALFESVYRERYGHANEGDPVEIVNARLEAFGRVEQAEWRVKPLARAGTPRTTRAVFNGTEIETLVVDRLHLGVGQSVRGPAIAIDPGSTTVVPPGWGGEVDRLGTLNLSRDP